jgi:hypothetical protein
MLQSIASFSLEFDAEEVHCDMVAVAEGSGRNRVLVPDELSELLSSIYSADEASRVLADLVGDRLDPRVWDFGGEYDEQLIGSMIERLATQGLNECNCTYLAGRAFIEKADLIIGQFGDISWLFGDPITGEDRLISMHCSVANLFYELFAMSDDWSYCRLSYSGTDLHVEFRDTNGEQDSFDGLPLCENQALAADQFIVCSYGGQASVSLREFLAQSEKLLGLAVTLCEAKYHSPGLATNYLMPIWSIVDELESVGADLLGVFEYEVAIALALDWNATLADLICSARLALVPCVTS